MIKKCQKIEHKHMAECYCVLLTIMEVSLNINTAFSLSENTPAYSPCRGTHFLPVVIVYTQCQTIISRWGFIETYLHHNNGQL